MRRIDIIVILFFCVLLVALSMRSAAQEDVLPDNPYVSELPFSKGEAFSYGVKYKGINAGRSTLIFHGEEQLGNRDVYHITFSTRVGIVTDKEELFADRETFLPVEVHRLFKKFGTFTENIIERYNQKDFRVDIEKKTRFRLRNISIKKDSPIHNAILLTYLYRAKDAFVKGERHKITLPSAEFEVTFDGIETVKTPLGDFSAYRFSSSPYNFQFWLGIDEKKLPLKIENPGRMMEYSLELDELL